MDAHSHSDVAAFLAELKTTVDAAVPLGDPKTVTVPDGFVLGMYWRARGLLEGITVLLAAMLADEALILARSLLEQSLHLQELAAAGEERVALVLDWYNRSLSEKLGLIRRAASRGDAGDLGITEKDVEEERKTIQGYMNRHSIKKLRRLMPLQASAARFNRSDELWVAGIADEVVHGSEIAHGPRRLALPGGGVGYKLRNDDPEMSAWVSALAARSMILSRIAAGTIFDWGQPEELAALLVRVDAFVAEEGRLVSR
jgi:Family of unknown function (DUF5677)